MKRVTSRQRLVSWDAFEATAVSDDDWNHPPSLNDNSIDPSPLLEKNALAKKRKNPCSLQETHIVPAFLQLDDLCQDVLLHTMSFLTPTDARCVSAMSRQFRRLLVSKKALYLWTDWCCQRWPTLVQHKNKLTFRDELFLPTAMSSFKDSLHANLSVLLGMASTTNPTKLEDCLLRRTATLDEFREFVQDNLTVVQYIGAVGIGDRSIRSDHALAKPTHHKSPLTRVVTRAVTFSNKSKSNMTGRKHGIRDFWRGSQQSCPFHWRPFVAPYMVPKSNQVHLTPRLFSYFEVTIVKRNPQQEPKLQNDVNMSETTENDCIAVGVSHGNFQTNSRMPGWDHYSYGYHGDDGNIFHGSGTVFSHFGPTFGAGDTVGCGVDYTSGGIFFTLNGKFLGYGWTNLETKFLRDYALYPTVGVDSNHPIACNFGERPFLFDVTALVQHQKQVVQKCLAPLCKDKMKNTNNHHKSISSKSLPSRYLRRSRLFRAVHNHQTA